VAPKEFYALNSQSFVAYLISTGPTMLLGSISKLFENASSLMLFSRLNLRELHIPFPVENREESLINEKEQHAIVRSTKFGNDNRSATARQGRYLAAVKQSGPNA